MRPTLRITGNPERKYLRDTNSSPTAGDVLQQQLSSVNGNGQATVFSPRGIYASAECYSINEGMLSFRQIRLSYSTAYSCHVLVVSNHEPNFASCR
jgi:hypothetical protein